MDTKLNKNSLLIWQLCDELTVWEAATLYIGEIPESEDSPFLDLPIYENNEDFEAALAFISGALLKGNIDGSIVKRTRKVSIESLEPTYADIEIPNTIDPRKSRVNVASLKRLLHRKNVKTGFFATSDAFEADYLDPQHPCYAPKLAAAVKAWLAVVEAKKYQDSKTPKQHIDKWLRENAPQFGLSDEEGKPNEQGIEEISKVANWRSHGGAGKTYSNPPTPVKSKGRGGR